MLVENISAFAQAVGEDIKSLGTASKADIQTSVTDGTPGRALLTGAFGLGGVSPLWPNASMIDVEDVEPGTYYASNRSDGPGPIPNYYGFVRLTKNINHAALEAIDVLGNIRVRSRDGATWGPWRDISAEERIYAQNGVAIRYGNGTQIAIGVSIVPGGSLDWISATYGSYAQLGSVCPWPAPFLEAPIIGGHSCSDGNVSGRAAYFGYVAAPNATSLSAGSFLMSPASIDNTSSLELKAIAIGRFK